MSRKGVSITKKDSTQYKIKTAEERLKEQESKKKEELKRNFAIVLDIAEKIDKYIDENPNDKNIWDIKTSLLLSFNEKYNETDHLDILISLYKQAGYHVSYNKQDDVLTIRINTEPTPRSSQSNTKPSDYCAHETF